MLKDLLEEFNKKSVGKVWDEVLFIAEFEDGDKYELTRRQFVKDFITQSIKQAFEETRLDDKRICMNQDANHQNSAVKECAIRNSGYNDGYNQANKDKKQKQSEWLGEK